MAAYADYTFYRQHGGKLTEAAYNASVEDAHAEILLQTNGAAQTAPVEMQEALKLCECKLVDVFAAYKEGAALLPKGVGNVSNDGYSVSAVTGGASDAAKAEAAERRAICVRYLQHPVNLMCRWI